MAVPAALLCLSVAHADVASSDPLLDLLIKKGLVTQDEANSVRNEADALRSNNIAAFPASRWKISNGIKSVELFGDVRVRFEDRGVHIPNGDRIELERYRYALRLGLRGDIQDNFYYGLRLETASNPRSPWVTFGTSSTSASGSPSIPVNGPFGKSTAGINLGMIYLGWKPANWLDITVGKMPNPLYFTPMVWDTDLSPEGAAETFKGSVGPLDVFATFGQFVYEDTNPNRTTAFIVPSLPFDQRNSTPFLFAWQAGFKYNIKPDTSFKMAATLYNYTGRGADLAGTATPGYSDTFVGAATNGANWGGAANAVYGASGYPNGGAAGFQFNQTGINNLLILDIPFEFNFKISDDLRARIFGDFAQNLVGYQRAEAATMAAASGFYSTNGSATLSIPLAKNDNKAYQFGMAIGNGAVARFDNIGMVYGSVIHRHTWEARGYYQHVEQYALDPNLLDSDFFEGRANMEGFYLACAYGFTDNLIGTVRYGYASRINKQLGTAGSNQDLPWVNPINKYQLLQADLTFKF